MTRVILRLPEFFCANGTAGHKKRVSQDTLFSFSVEEIMLLPEQAVLQLFLRFQQQRLLRWL